MMASIERMIQKFISSIFYHKTDPCPSTLPTIASETNSYSESRLPAKAALTDWKYEGQKPVDHDYWAGKKGLTAQFVIDLGCDKTLIKIEMRNIQNDSSWG